MSEYYKSDADKEKAPIYEALLAYRHSKQRSFHVPGHKNGQVYYQWMQQTEVAGDAATKETEKETTTKTGEVIGTRTQSIPIELYRYVPIWR